GSAYQTLIERWDGASWAVVASPNNSASPANALLGVTCVAAADCWAVGVYYNGSAYQTLIEHWDGTSWAIVTSPNISASPETELEAVACTSASDCWTVGSYVNANGNYQTLIERWDGTSWAIVSSPDDNPWSSSCVASGHPPGWTPDHVLVSFASASASGCGAGGYYIGSNNQTLTERWDGTSWAIVISP